MKVLARMGAVIAVLLVTGCTTEEERERACFEKLLADFEQSQAFADQQAAASPWASDEAMSWRRYALTAAESALSISIIHSDDDRNACDYVSAGAHLQLK